MPKSVHPLPKKTKPLGKAKLLPHLCLISAPACVLLPANINSDSRVSVTSPEKIREWYYRVTYAYISFCCHKMNIT